MIELPFNSSDFAEAWSDYLLNKKESHNFEYKNNRSMKMALKKLFRYSQGSEKIAIAILEVAISENWKGFFPLDYKDPLMLEFRKAQNPSNLQKKDAGQILLEKFGIK